MVKRDVRAGAIKSEANFTAFLTFGLKILYIKKYYKHNFMIIRQISKY